MQRFRGGLVFKAHRLFNHSILGLRVIKKRREPESVPEGAGANLLEQKQSGYEPHEFTSDGLQATVR